MWRRLTGEDRPPEPGQSYGIKLEMIFRNYESSRRTGKVFLLLFLTICDLRPVIPPSSPSKSPQYPQPLADSPLNVFGGRMCSFPRRFRRFCPYSPARWTQAAGSGEDTSDDSGETGNTDANSGNSTNNAGSTGAQGGSDASSQGSGASGGDGSQGTSEQTTSGQDSSTSGEGSGT